MNLPYIRCCRLTSAFAGDLTVLTTNCGWCYDKNCSWPLSVRQHCHQPQ